MKTAALSLTRALPATGTAATRTLGGAAVLLVSGWMLLYLARPERRPVPGLRELTDRRTRTHRRRTTE
ncbi:MAG: LPXTG cell wall anchor domain-containing protein [Actinobacteria bacterium]|nr:LPXTG cell wall anchor domain-containing protein [Actinomycetota bacterium]